MVGSKKVMDRCKEVLYLVVVISAWSGIVVGKELKEVMRADRLKRAATEMKERLRKIQRKERVTS